MNENKWKVEKDDEKKKKLVQNQCEPEALSFLLVFSETKFAFSIIREFLLKRVAELQLGHHWIAILPTAICSSTPHSLYRPNT